MKPLLICDCDEVLVHMVRHFRSWLDESHDMDFALDTHDFFGSMTRRQTLVPHAAEALSVLGQTADIVILTNLVEECRVPRIEQLARFGIHHHVQCNTGGKGEPVARLVADHGHPVTVFVDDLAQHHASVATHAPQVHRLHMVSEPEMAPHVPPAPARGWAEGRAGLWPDAGRADQEISERRSVARRAHREAGRVRQFGR